VIPLRRRCDVCAEQYEAKRATSKFCSPKCRVRAGRDRRQGVDVPAQVEVAGATSSGVAAATRVELDAAGRTDTARGQVALALAARIDSGRDTGSALAVLAKEHRAALDAAVQGAAKTASPLDELRLRREARNAG
jgi:hypothetical protein